MVCILCGKSCDDMYGVFRPGTPARCRDHAWKDLDDWELFSMEEAIEAGRQRVMLLSSQGRAEEGMIAHAKIEEWKREIDRMMRAVGNVPTYFYDALQRKEAYLKAFD